MEKTAVGDSSVEANPPLEIVWNEKGERFETVDKEAFLQYHLRDVDRVANPDQERKAAAAMDIVHTYVPRSKRGMGLAARLCDAAFAHAQCHSMLVIPTCSYISDTYLPRNPEWNSLVYNGGPKSSM
ncbi:hypothetical protein Cni_G19925 [Canna indica]|uniref:N-acetyltransferase domain-containing protein n=1 Tax=Canna indica TaxID=4628 RepID=A0AAQ3KMY2_9LILI|nr:hypothetical protein Cni_G19925 [Canna indica]